ncbi:MAG TPA: kelch repeat-containing protein [Nevskiaceae bacterium]|nr:kelch repeat-containing protein [Nevskiaceae bacterium]
MNKLMRTALGVAFFSATAIALPAAAGPAACEFAALRNATGVGAQTPTTNAWAATCGTPTARVDHTVTPLAFGETLVAGGYHYVQSFYPMEPLNSAEIYEERTGQFIPTVGSLNVPRYAHTATRLTSGKVLIVGGGDAPAFPPNGLPVGQTSSEIYSPVTQTFLFGPSLVTPRLAGHAATLLTDGRVLVTGGNFCPLGDPKGCHVTDTAEIYDPASNRFVGTGSMTTPRQFHTATLLADGRVLIAGGSGWSDSATTAEIFNPATGRFTAVGATMTTARYNHAAARLASGRVILGGGNVSSAEVFNPATGQFTAAGSMSFTTNERPAAALLPDGKVVFVHDFDADVYDPAANRFTTGAYAYANSASFDFPEGGAGALLHDGLFLWTGGLTGAYPPAASPDAYLYRPPN